MFKTSNSKLFVILNIGIWDLFVIWCLIFEIYLVIRVIRAIRNYSTVNMNFKKILISKPVLLAEIIILGYFAVNVGQEMYKRHDITAEIKRLETEISKLEGGKSDLSSLLSYVQTDAFVEQEARAKLNLAKAGESLVLLPSADTPESGVSEEPAAPPGEANSDQAAPKHKSNLTKWRQYFFEYDRLALE